MIYGGCRLAAKSRACLFPPTREPSPHTEGNYL